MSRGASLTQMHVMEQLGRLLEIYPRPSHASPDSAKLAAPYLDVLRGRASVEQLTQAVTVYRASPARFFPRPGELLKLALEQPGVVSAFGDEVSRFWTWMRGDWMTPCPACDAPWTHTLAGRLVIVHHHYRHRALGLPCIMACDEGTCIPTGVPAMRTAERVPAPSLVGVALAEAYGSEAQQERAAIAEEGNA